MGWYLRFLYLWEQFVCVLDVPFEEGAMESVRHVRETTMSGFGPRVEGGATKSAPYFC
jgi:hypothetical protein